MRGDKLGMTHSTSARQALRTATAGDHARVDRAFGAFDLSRRDGYVRFLLAQAEAFLPVEAAIDAAHPRDAIPDWPARRRAAALLTDLDALGIAQPACPPCPSFRNREEILGAIYVLEGSRLGGKLLARSVPADLPSGFLGAGDAAMWRNLIGILDKLLICEEQRAAAIATARHVFALFEAGARRHQGT